MKETGIIMSGNHPKLILDGIKTMTRRVINLKGYSREIWDSCVPHNGEAARLLGEPYLKVPYDRITDNAGNRITCPYGQVGDILIVKETWASENHYNHLKPSEIPRTATIYYPASIQYDPFTMGVKRSAMFMCYWMSRARLEITSLRDERLQEIAAGDCTREGIPYEDGDYVTMKVFAKFRTLWDSLNAKRAYSWSSNPWVWRISFRKLV